MKAEQIEQCLQSVSNIQHKATQSKAIDIESVSY